MDSKNVNYTPEQESIIRGFTGTGTDGALTKTDTETLAADPRLFKDGKARSAKSLVAKINRMGLAYERAQPTRKDGSKVETKAEIVAQIAGLAGVSFENLAVAARSDLVKIRDWASKLAA